MPYLVIATTNGASAPFARLVTALQRTHGYQVAVVEAPADATLLRLGNHQMFVAYEVAGVAPLRQPLLIRLSAPAPGTAYQADRLDIEFISVPSSLHASAQRLLLSPAPLLFGRHFTTWPATQQTLAIPSQSTIHRFLHPHCTTALPAAA
jgi:hypothetical protein